METILDQPGRTLTIRAYLPLEEGTNLQDYQLEINPYHDMSFTGKFLEPEIGLIYFGGRWYEPGIGRWVTPDPGEDGLNWYEYCTNDPISNFDPDGWISLRNLWGLACGVGEGFKVYAPKKALEIAQAVAIGAVMTVGMTYLMQLLPAAVPTLVAVMGWVSTTASALTFAYNIATDLQFII